MADYFIHLIILRRPAFRALVILSLGGINDEEPGSSSNSCKR